MKAILALFLVAALFAVAYSQVVYTSAGIPLASNWGYGSVYGSPIVTSAWGGVPVVNAYSTWLKK